MTVDSRHQEKYSIDTLRTVNGLSLDHSKHFYTSSHIYPFKHTYTLMAGAAMQDANLLITHTFTHCWTSHWEQFRVQYLGHRLEEPGIELLIF